MPDPYYMTNIRCPNDLGYYASTHVLPANPAALANARLSPRPNPSGCRLGAWPGLKSDSQLMFSKRLGAPGGTFTLKSLRLEQEEAMIAEIDRRWLGLTPAQQYHVRDYVARWGPDAKPVNEYAETAQQRRITPDDHRYARAKFWRQGRHLPKCNSCCKGHRAMPTQPGCTFPVVPIGIDAQGNKDEDRLHCGCLVEEALVKMWVERRGYWQGGEMRSHRSAWVNFFKDVFGGVSYNLFKSRGNMIANLQELQGQGSDLAIP